MNETTLEAIIKDPDRHKYDFFFKDKDVPKKVRDIYFLGGHDIVAFHRQRQDVGEVSGKERRSTMKTVNKYPRRKTLNFVMLWDAAQYEAGCDHYKDGIPDDVTQCECYKFLYELLSDNDVFVRVGRSGIRYKLRVVE